MTKNIILSIFETLMKVLLEYSTDSITKQTIYVSIQAKLYFIFIQTKLCLKLYLYKQN